MNVVKEIDATAAGSGTPREPDVARKATGASIGAASVFKRFLIFLVVVALCFSWALKDWLRLAFADSLYSHLPLLPLVVAWLVWLRREELRSLTVKPAPVPAVGLALAGALVGALSFLGHVPGPSAPPDDVVFWELLGACLLIVAGVCWFFGIGFLKRCWLPVLLLVFVLPFPHRVFLGLQTLLQTASAEVSYWVLSLTGTPVFRQDFTFLLPGFTFNVAPECSGIRSTVVLLITSLVAGGLFLKAPWRQAVLAAIVVPLGVLRNTLRIVTIATLCVHVDPSYIDSPIHHQGGPLFFLISLVPFFLILRWLRISVTHRTAPAGESSRRSDSTGG